MKEKYLEILRGASESDTHEEIVKCLDYYGKYSTMELTDEEVRDYLIKRGLLKE